jgi:hypothetical protein
VVISVEFDDVGKALMKLMNLMKSEEMKKSVDVGSKQTRHLAKLR